MKFDLNSAWENESSFDFSNNGALGAVLSPNPVGLAASRDDDDDYDEDDDDWDEEDDEEDDWDEDDEDWDDEDEEDWDDEDEDYEEGFDFGDPETTIYEVECACGNIIDFDEETLEEGSIVCPNCGETLEFSLEDEDEDEE